MTAKGTRSAACRLAAGIVALCAAISADARTARSGDDLASKGHPRTIVIGFLGGYVSRNSPTRSEVKMANRLRTEYADTALVETFENRRQDAAYQAILKFLGGAKNAKLSDEQKRQARVVIYGHSWGGWATVELARKLEKEGIPVLLTIQIDSVGHW